MGASMVSYLLTKSIKECMLNNAEKLKWISQRRTAYREKLTRDICDELDSVFPALTRDEAFEVMDAIINWNVGPFVREIVDSYFEEEAKNDN